MVRKGEVLVYQAEDGLIKVDVRLEDENVWQTQALMADLFQTSTDNISLHLKNIYAEGELDAVSTTEDYSVVRQEGQRQVKRKLKYYNLDAILQLNGRELLIHADRVSHQVAAEKAALEYEKYRGDQKQISRESSLKEIEEDIEHLQGKLC